MSVPSRGLQSIYEKHPDAEEGVFTFLNEDSLEGKTVLLPSTATLENLKEQVRKDNNYPPDSKCVRGHFMKLIYPKDGIELATAHHVEKHQSKKKAHKNCVELTDESRWIKMKKHWNSGTSHRRDVSLVKYTSEVANIIGSNAPASSTLAAAKRLCCIIGVPHNVSSIKRLKRNYIIFNAVHDLIKYRDPHVTQIVDNCEALSIACGAHLHWFLSQASPSYRHHRTDGGYKVEGEEGSVEDEGDDDGVGVPPEYEKYVRLIKLGQSVKPTIKQMLAEGLDPTVIGLIDPNDEKELQTAKKRKSKDSVASNGDSDDEKEAVLSYDAPTTEALLLALKHVTGAIRYRQRKIISEAMAPPPPPPATAAPTINGTNGDDATKKPKPSVSIQIDTDENADDASSSSNSQSQSKQTSIKEIEHEESAVPTSLNQSKLTIIVDDDGDVELQHDAHLWTENELKTRKMLNNKIEKDVSKSNDLFAYPWLEFMDNIIHSDWDQCSDECLDVTAYMCLGAVWCNLEKNEDAIWCHGEEALSYALLLSIHGGCTNFSHHQGVSYTPSEPLTAKLGGGPLSPTTPGSGGGGAAPSSPTGVPNMKSNETFSKHNVTGFVDEDSYIFQMQSVATHLACFLLTVEPGLKLYLSAQSGCPQSLPALQSTLHAVLYEPISDDLNDIELLSPLSPNQFETNRFESSSKMNDKDNTATQDEKQEEGEAQAAINYHQNSKLAVYNEIRDKAVNSMGLTLVLPGLSELTMSKDPKIAMCGATMVAGIVANLETRNLISGVSAQLALPAMLSYALKVLFKRNQYRDLKQAEISQIKEDVSGEENVDKKKEGKSNIKKRKPFGSKFRGNNELSDVSVEGFSPEVLAALRGHDGNNAASKFDHALVAVWGLLHVLYSRKGVIATAQAEAAAAAASAHSNVGVGSDHARNVSLANAYKSPSRKQRHHLHRKLMKQMQNSKSYGVKLENRTHSGASTNGASSSVHDQIKGLHVEVEKVNAKDSILFEVAAAPSLKICHAAASIPLKPSSNKPTTSFTSSRVSGAAASSPPPPLNGGNLTLGLSDAENDLSRYFVREELLIDDLGNEVSNTLVERVVLLCSSWNKPHALRELSGYENPNTNIEEVTAQAAKSFREEEHEEVIEKENEEAAGGEEEEEEEGEEEEATAASAPDAKEELEKNDVTENDNVEDPREPLHPPSSAAQALFSDFEGKEIKESSKEDGEKQDSNAATGGGNDDDDSSSQKSASVSFNKTPSPLRKSIASHHKALFQYQALPKGSGGSGYGPLSEVEIRCSLGCLALVAQVDCVKATALLGSIGLARILLFAEMNPEQGASEEVQEVALSALSYLTSAADSKYLKMEENNVGGFGSSSSMKYNSRAGGTHQSHAHHNQHHNQHHYHHHHHHQHHHHHSSHAHHSQSRHRGGVASKQMIATSGNEELFVAWDALRQLVNDHHAIERMSALRQLVTLKARQGSGASRRDSARIPSKQNNVNTTGEQNQPLPPHFTMNRRMSYDPIERERTKQRRWDMVKSVAMAIMHLSALESSENIRKRMSSQSPANKDREGATSTGTSDVKSGVDNALNPVSNDGAVAASSTADAADSGGGSAKGNVKEDGVSTEVAKRRETTHASALATVMVAAQARSLFARKRLECVAQQLWSDNKTVVTEACASVWLLGRSLAVRAALSRLCVDGQNKVTGLISGRHFPMVSRLIECASGSSDDALRAWALAALSTLCCDPNFQKKHANQVIPCFVEILVAYADEGDPKERKKREKKEKKDREQFHKARASFTSGILPKEINYIVGGARSASAALYQSASLAKQRLAAISVSSLLLLAYFHTPSLNRLRKMNFKRKVQSRNESSLNGFGGIEYALYRMCKRKDLCRRVKTSAGHLLLLLCTEDMDNYLSHCRNPHNNAGSIFTPVATASNDGASVSGDTFDKTNNSAAPDPTVVYARSGLVPPPDVGPLWRLNASSKKTHTSIDKLEEGTVLEELFLHMLHEEVGQDYESVQGLDHFSVSDLYREGGDTPGLFDDFNHNFSNGFGLSSAASYSSFDEGLSSSKRQKDPTIPQATEFGFLDGGDGDEYEVEKDNIIRLCLHALTDLAARRDRAKFIIISQGGANIASKLIREQRLENKMRYDDMMEEYDVDGEVEGDDSEDEEEEFELKEGDGNSAKEEWKIIMPLHLILNCSTCEKAQPRLCNVVLDDLIRATMTLSGTHGSAVLEVQLAYGALANISRNATCRSLIYKHSLAAGVLPPGARDWTNGKTFTTSSAKSEDEIDEENIKVSWDYAGKHPLYQVVKQQNSQNNSLISAPKKDKSYENSFGRTTNSTGARPTTSKSQEFKPMSTLRPVTAPSSSPSSQLPSNNPLNSLFGGSLQTLSENRKASMSGSIKSGVSIDKLKGDASISNKKSLDLVNDEKVVLPPGSLLEHTSNHPACDKDPIYKKMHPAVGLYQLSSLGEGSKDLKPIQTPASAASTFVSPIKKVGSSGLDKQMANAHIKSEGSLPSNPALMSSLGFSTGHFGGLENSEGKMKKLSMLGTSGRIDVDDELTISGNEDDELKGVGDGLDGDGNKLASHVAAVQSWMFKSNITKPPEGAPQPHHIATNAPILLPDPAADNALHIAANHPAAPLIAGKKKQSSSSSSSSLWGGDEFNPPGASTTRGRTSDDVSSKLSHNIAYPYGVDGWHPDIVHCSAERKEWLQMEEGGGLSKMDTLAGSALASTFKKKKSNAKAAKLKKKVTGLKQLTLTATTSAKLQKSIDLKKKRVNSLNDDDDDEGNSEGEKSGLASKIAKHKLKVLRKVLTTNSAITKHKKTTTVGGNAVGAISLTVNPNVCRGNHFSFTQEKGRPEPPSKSKQGKSSGTLPSLGSQSVNTGEGDSLSIMSTSRPSSPLGIVSSGSSMRGGAGSGGGGDASVVSKINDFKNAPVVPSLSKGEKVAVKAALNQLNTKKVNHLHQQSDGVFEFDGKKEKSGLNHEPIYPELESINKRGPMTASERRAEKLRAASAFACKNATRVSKPRKDVSRIWMWHHVEGSQVSQDAGLIPYQLPVTNPLAKKTAVTAQYRNPDRVSSLGPDGKKKNMFHNLMAAAIANSANSAIETGGTKGVGFKSPNSAAAAAAQASSVSNTANKFKNSIRIASQMQSRGEAAVAGSRIITAPFFFHLKTNPASPFPPPPLPPPPPPNLRCDVFQRYLPTIENGTSADGASGGPEHQISGEWVKLESGPLKQHVKVPPTMPGPYVNVPDEYNPELTAAVTVPCSEVSPLGIGSPLTPKVNVPTVVPLVRAAGFVPSPVVEQQGSTNIGMSGTSSPAPTLKHRKASKHFSHASMDLDTMTGTLIDPHKISIERLAWLHSPRVFDALVPVAVGDHVVVGGMPLKHLSLLVRPPKALPPPTPKAVVVPPPKVKGPPWDYNVSSIFVPRRTTTDAKSMVDIPHQRIGGKTGSSNVINMKKFGEDRAEVSIGVSKTNSRRPSAGRMKPAKKRAGPFDHDWQKCLAKSDRFYNLIKKGIYENDHPDLVATAESLKKHYDWLMYIFLVHASNDTSATDASCMGWMSYGALMVASGIQDNESKACREADIDTIFKAANFEVKGTDVNDDNPLDALTRQEWLEIIIRCARAKFGSTPATKNEPIGDLVEKLVCLMKERLGEEAEANEDEASVNDLRHEWRLTYFYVEDTDKVYRSYEDKLLSYYKSKIDFKDVGHHHYWTLGMWQSLMEEADFYLDCASFSREDGNLCFYWSKFTVYDYVANIDEYAHMDWLSFLEALGHVARIKQLPKVSDLSAKGFVNIVELHDKLELLNSDMDSWMEENCDESKPEDPFHVKLDALLQLMFHVINKKQASHKAAKLALQKAAAAAASGAAADK